MSMTTLTATKARINLSSLLRRALKGDDIGIVIEGKIVALRPVDVVSTEYMQSEYELEPGAWKRVAKNLHEKGQKARSSGEARRFTGNIEDALKG
jgi:antitoxin (DNA-binding transcriptional repressor) of toxin-antitoxin stability system